MLSESLLKEVFGNKNLLYLILKDTVVCDRNALCHTSKKMNEWIEKASEHFGETHKHLQYNKCYCYKSRSFCGEEIAKSGCIRRGKNNVGYYAKYGWLNEVRYLVADGADITAKDNYAVRWASSNGHIRVVEYLHKHGADITAANNAAIRWAAANGHLRVVEHLHKHGADITANDNYAIRWASTNRHIHVVEYLKKIYIKTAGKYPIYNKLL